MSGAGEDAMRDALTVTEHIRMCEAEVARAKAFLADVVALLDDYTVYDALMPSERNRLRRAKEYLDGTR